MIRILTIIVLMVSLYGYLSQYKKSSKKRNFEFFDDYFIILNGITCLIICLYKFIIGDIIFLVYNAFLLLFYIIIYIHKYSLLIQ